MRPILFSIGPLPIYSFGFMIVLGVFLSLQLMTRKAAARSFLSKDKVLDLVFVVLGCGFLGGRAAYIIQYRSWYLQDPLKVLAVWEGGLIFYGGLIGAFLGVFFYAKRHKHSIGEVFDFLMPYVALSQAFGRIGCFLNGCCYGKVCDLPWATKVSGQVARVHPTQLYEALFLVALSVILMKLYDQRKSPGTVAFFYFGAYAVGRFVIEFFRDGNPELLFFTWNQWISLLIFSIAAFFFLKIQLSDRGHLGKS